MAEEYIDSRCDSCVHSKACTAWIQHGSTLYSDFSYSVEDCPDYVSSADVVEVVRCKDCKYSCDEDITGKYILCNGKMLGMVRAEDFCSFGERRDNNAKTD